MHASFLRLLKPVLMASLILPAVVLACRHFGQSTEFTSDFLVEFLAFSIPAYIAEGKTRLTIAIGCTGGYHRSIVIAEELAAWLGERGTPVSVFHRELDRS